MSQPFADNAIALLIDLAQRGEVDPWDVNVVEVFDRFLTELACYDAKDLAASGQAFLYASMLVLLKAETLAGFDPPEDLVDEVLDVLDYGEADFDGQPLPHRLEQHIHRRPVALPFKKRRVTLGELIQQLELIAVAVERQSGKPRVRKKVVRPSRAQSLKTIAQLSHPENLSEVAVELEQLLAAHCSGEQWVEFSTLLGIKNDRVGLFWALLLLSAQKKVELNQDEFYQDLKLRPIPETEAIDQVFLPNLNSAAS